ncbi:ATP synthase F0 subunit A [Deltaproteobacteria bacterium Smac51]|nr:ATP synthase F0 subunit A [Deltaproteobacteria bacterium Smac51]
MEHPIMFLAVLADLIGGSVSDFAHHYPHVLYSWMVMIILIVLARLATAKISMVPSGLQNLFEFLVETIENFQLSIMGEKGRVFFPLIATLLIYVFSCNVQGLIPGSFAPTSNINTTVGLAIVIFVMTHAVGIKMHGFHYIKHFLGPLPLLAPLMFVIEVVSHLSRLISLTLRLFGNVMGEDLVILVLFALAGAYFAPLPMMFLGLFTGFLQAFIISLLAMIYISDAQGDSH